MQIETLLTVKEAAASLGVSESAVRNATLEGRLPFVRRYGRKLIEAGELESYRRRTRPAGVKPTGRPRRSKPVLDVAALESDDPGRDCRRMTAAGTRHIWDTPEEDAAWAHL